MKYHYTTSPEVVTEYLTEQLGRALYDNKTVCWLIPGGSALSIACDVARRLHDYPLKKLHVTLTDERYGAPGHHAENWDMLQKQGFSLPGSELYRVLQTADNRRALTKQFDAVLRRFIESSDVSIGLFGVGSDGHTAGIKPHAFPMDADCFATDFTGEDFERITMTPHAIAQLSLAVAYACGNDKQQTLQTLVSTDIAVGDQPAQSLKKAKASILFTDQQLET